MAHSIGHNVSSSFSGTNVFRGSRFLSHSWLHWALAAKTYTTFNQRHLQPLMPFSASLLLLLDLSLPIRQWPPILRCTTRPPFLGKLPIMWRSAYLGKSCQVQNLLVCISRVHCTYRTSAFSS